MNGWRRCGTYIHSEILLNPEKEWHHMVLFLQSQEITGDPEYLGGFSLQHHILVFSRKTGHLGWEESIEEEKGESMT